MKWLQFLTLILLMAVVAPREVIEQRRTVGLPNPIGNVSEGLVESPREVDEEELHCLSLAVFKEVRGESTEAQIVVAQTILNRVGNEAFPDTVCKVVKQKLKGNCMFSWWCYKDREVVTDIKAYNKANKIAYKALLGDYEHKSTSTYFRRCDNKHKFFDKLEFRGKIGATCFYREWRK